MIFFLQEILTVSPQTTPLLPQEPPYSLSSATKLSHSPSSELVIAIVIGTTCFVAVATAVVFVCKSRFLRRRPTNNPNPVEFTLIQGNGSMNSPSNACKVMAPFITAGILITVLKSLGYAFISYFDTMYLSHCLISVNSLHFEDPPS